jgi:hypothetical protein
MSIEGLGQTADALQMKNDGLQKFFSPGGCLTPFTLERRGRAVAGFLTLNAPGQHPHHHERVDRRATVSWAATSC